MALGLATAIEILSAPDGASEIESPKIYTMGDPILSRQCRILSADEIVNNEDVHAAARIAHVALADFRRRNGFGRAIAAPQVGFPLSFVALNLGEPLTMYNPEIIYRSADMFTMWDDCLSFPQLLVRVQRHDSISVQFLNSRGEQETWNNLNRSVSELLQHEIDHLNGILAVERRMDVLLKSLSDSTEVVLRTNWEQEKEKYLAMVDYTI